MLSRSVCTRTAIETIDRLTEVLETHPPQKKRNTSELCLSLHVCTRTAIETIDRLMQVLYLSDYSVLYLSDYSSLKTAKRPMTVCVCVCVSGQRSRRSTG